MYAIQSLKKEFYTRESYSYSFIIHRIETSLIFVRYRLCLKERLLKFILKKILRKFCSLEHIHVYIMIRAM